MTNHIAHTLTIPEDYAGKRLDQTVAALLPDYSRSRIKEWIDAGDLLVDGNIQKGKFKLAGNETIELNTTLENEVDWQAEAIELNIVYEDDAIIIVNKPANLVVHPAAGNQNGTLVNALLNHCPELEKLPRAGLIHRIDKDTTGLLVIAKTISAHTSLVQQLQERTMKREYAAIVNGVLTGGGTVDAPIGRHPKSRQKMAVVPNGKPAVTHYRLIEKFAGHTFIRVMLESGRTHQIRVHMAHINHPVLGDQTYARLQFPKGASDELKDTLRGFKRQALHARKLTLMHPETDEEMMFEAELPSDMLALIEVLKKGARNITN